MHKQTKVDQLEMLLHGKLNKEEIRQMYDHMRHCTSCQRHFIRFMLCEELSQDILKVLGPDALEINAEKR
jgi:hypothetical protein